MLTAAALVAFAGNSILCRAALLTTSIDAASFTFLRLFSGAVVLILLVWITSNAGPKAGDWTSAAALFVYAAALSFAYIDLPTGLGALLLFGSVQLTMIGFGIARGERISLLQWLALCAAITGLIFLLLPERSITSSPLLANIIMLSSGIAWGVYSLRGRGAQDATAVTAGNFLRAVPMVIICLVLYWPKLSLDATGALYAIASGAITSGLGYALWYRVLPQLRASNAATLQLTVPVLATAAGVLFLSETISLKMVLASSAILVGVAIFVLAKRA